MKLCSEGAYTIAHLCMAGFGGGLIGLVVAAILHNAGLIRDPPPEG